MNGAQVVQRTWSLQAAQAAVPRVEGLLEEGRDRLERLRRSRTHVRDLRIVWEDHVHDPGCPDHDEFRQRLQDFEEHRDALVRILHRFSRSGIHLKDLDSGLVDFLTLRGREPVFLCYRSGEDVIGYWHPLHAGYAGRQRLPDVEALEAARRA